jgi:protein-tyrosine phosphatase
VLYRRRRHAGLDQLDPSTVDDLVVIRCRDRDGPAEMVGDAQPHAADRMHSVGREFRAPRETRIVRWVELEGVANLRDIGGYSAQDGRSTRWRTVYRSGSLHALRDPDIVRVRRLVVRSVIDLRTDTERGGAEAWIGDADVEVIRLPAANPAASSLATGQYAPVALYLADLSARARDFVALLGVLVDAERLPAIVQCSGGKDRTGVMIGLLLSTLGVPDEIVAEDYGLSDEFRTRDPDGFAAASARVSDAGLDPEVLRTRPQTMTRFLEELRVRHGSVRALAESAGMTVDVLHRVRSNLLETTPGG